MAAMDQGKLDAMVGKITQEHSGYRDVMNGAQRDMKTAFDTNWVSNASKKLAEEISEANLELARGLADVFNSSNEAIRTAVNNFNATEDESISYSGFEWTIPNTTITVASKLPDGKVGVAEGADISSIEKPIDTMTQNVAAKLEAIEAAIRGSDAFDSGEVEALTSRISNIKTTYVSKMDEERNSLRTRMSGEISQRDQLDKVNRQNLGGQ